MKNYLVVYATSRLIFNGNPNYWLHNAFIEAESKKDAIIKAKTEFFGDNDFNFSIINIIEL